MPADRYSITGHWQSHPDAQHVSSGKLIRLAYFGLYFHRARKPQPASQIGATVFDRKMSWQYGI
jgi:hypothetical protein